MAGQRRQSGRATDLPGGTVTFFFSDVEGSTRLATALGDAFAEVLEDHRRVIRAAFAATNGMEVSTGGDSFFAVFLSPADALSAAAAVQRGLSERGHERDVDIRVRIGLHTGQAVRVGADYVGLDVHRAARISDAGHGGQVLVSETTHAATSGALPDGLALVDLGRYRLKDVGPQRLWQLEGPGLPSGPFPPLRSLEAHPTNLAVPASVLVGRARELAELRSLLADSSVVTITGAGGIGKTRVALEVARSLVATYPDGVFHLDLAAITDARSVATSLLEVMGVSSDDDPQSVLLDRLRNRDLLVVLDTADRVAGLPALVASIAGSCPRIRLLVTSRSPLRIAAEREYTLAPLPVSAAAELFAARAAAVRPQFILDAASRGPVERLVARLDGIPFAIELAAARIRVFSPAALLDRLERHLPALGEGARDLPDRQRTLEDTIRWSYELLGDAEQAIFRQLGVFAGPFDLSAYEDVVIDPGGGDVVALLEALVDRSLVVAEEDPSGDPRFRTLGPIRDFAMDRLRAGGDEPSVRERHARHWLAWMRLEADRLHGDASLEVLAAIRAVEADLRAALAWWLVTPAGAGTDARPHASGLELAGLLGRYWWLKGRVREGLDWLEPAIGATPDAPTADRARALFWAGVLLDVARRPAEAATRLEAALALQRELGDDAGMARTLNSLGVVARSLGDLDRAQSLLTESIERKRRLDDQSGIAVSLSNLGVVASDRGRLDDAVGYMRQALAIDERTGGGSVVVSCANLGSSLVKAGRFEEGLVQVGRALPGIAELEDPELVIEMLTSLATVVMGSSLPDAPERAARLLFASDALRERERLPLLDADREEAAALHARISAGLDAARLESARAEAPAVDVAAGLALAQDALSSLTRASMTGGARVTGVGGAPG
jgi:predicted ATPase/class 3 adenylate cyclase